MLSIGTRSDGAAASPSAILSSKTNEKAAPTIAFTGSPLDRHHGCVRAVSSTVEYRQLHAEELVGQRDLLIDINLPTARVESASRLARQAICMLEIRQPGEAILGIYLVSTPVDAYGEIR